MIVRHFNPRQYAAIVATFARWVVLGAAAGALAGPSSAVFLLTLRWASRIHTDNPWLLLLLPVAGIVIWLGHARLAGSAERGNNLLIEELHLNRGDVPRRLIPLGFLSPVITLIFGGSVASVGTAVQMGGAFAGWLARALRVSKEERRVLLMAGLSGGFGSVVGAPMAGAIFGMEVQSVGRIRYEGLVPCLVSSLVGYQIVKALGIYSGYPQLEPIALEPVLALKVALSGVAFGLCSLAFIESTRAIGLVLARLAGRRGWLRPLLGGLIIIALAGLLGTQAYLGLSESVLAAVWAGASVSAFAFALKLLFTALTVGAGYKGGDITPLFIMGATLGYVLAPGVGAPPLLMASIGFAAVFAGASNTPLASAVMGAELFGTGGLGYLFIGTVVSYVFSGHRSIYVTQRVDTPKYMFQIPKRFSVRDVMRKAPVSVRPDTPLAEVLALLSQRQVRSVVVLDGATVAGIITTGDLLRRGGLTVTAGPQGAMPALDLAADKTARDVMTARPRCVDASASLDEAARIMTGGRLKRLPVITATGELCGIISRSDILVCLARAAHMRIDTPMLTATEPGQDSRVLGWMRPLTATVGPTDSFAIVLERLMSDPLRRVVVVDGSMRAVGIIVDADVLERVSGAQPAGEPDAPRGAATRPYPELAAATAADVMSPVVHTIRADAPPIDAIRLMMEKRVKRLIVVDGQDHVLGVADRHDMLRAMVGGTA